MVYEVYICKYNGEIVYVGEGIRGRHRHCNSGKSHVYELNELYFTGDKTLFNIDVSYVASKKIARETETRLIKKYKPKFNKVGVTNDRGAKGVFCARFKLLLTNAVNDSDLTSLKKEKLNVCFDQFLIYHSHDMLKNEGLLIRKHNEYRSLGLDTLGYTVNGLKHGGMKAGNIPHSFKSILEDIYLLHFGKVENLRFI